MSYEFCGLTYVKDCKYESLNSTILSYNDDIYCCNYMLGSESPQLSQQQLFDKITLVRDLNMASLVSDYLFWIMAVCSYIFLKIICNKKHNKSTSSSPEETDIAKQVTLIITAIGSLVDIGITFAIVAIINENKLIDTLWELYEYSCYSDELAATILDLQNQFGNVLILDTVEGAVDILSIIILVAGCVYFKCGDITGTWTAPEGIHTFMFGVLDIILITINVFIFVLPSYSTFVSSYDNEEYMCFEKRSPTATPTAAPTETQSTARPTIQTTIMSYPITSASLILFNATSTDFIDEKLEQPETWMNWLIVIGGCFGFFCVCTLVAWLYSKKPGN